MPVIRNENSYDYYKVKMTYELAILEKGINLNPVN